MNPQQLKQQLHCLTVDAAITILIQKGRENLLFHWGTQPFTPHELREYLDNSVLITKCGLLNGIHFYGGPPGKLARYSGTLLTVVCDTMLYDNAWEDACEKEVIYLGREN